MWILHAHIGLDERKCIFPLRPIEKLSIISLGVPGNVMRKLAGGEKSQWTSWLGWDMRGGNGAKPASCDWVVWVRWTFQNTLRHQLEQIRSVSSAYRSLYIGHQNEWVDKETIVVKSHFWSLKQAGFHKQPNFSVSVTLSWQQNAFPFTHCPLFWKGE